MRPAPRPSPPHPVVTIQRAGRLVLVALLAASLVGPVATSASAAVTSPVELSPVDQSTVPEPTPPGPTSPLIPPPDLPTVTTPTALSYVRAQAQAAVAAAAVPEPTVPILTAPEALSRFQGQVTCDPVEKLGTQRLRSLLRTSYGKANTGGIVRACSIGGNSQHKEGRAYDWALNAGDPADRAIADAFLTWLTGPDGAGVPAGNAARLGVQYVIWNRQIWGAYSPTWKPYSGESPHTDHIHISLSWDGAFARTSWWTGSAVTRVDHGPCAVYVDVLVAPYSQPNYTRCPTPVPLSVLPTGYLDEVRPVLDGVLLRGWAKDVDVSGPIAVHAYADGAGAGAFVADRSRGDVGPHGFEIRLPLPPGQHRVCVYAIDTGAGGYNPVLGCASASRLSNPFGSHDPTALVPGGVRTSGWAIDPDSAAPVPIHLYVDGRFGGALSASGARPDVGAVFPGRGDAFGFAAVLPLAAGSHDVCAYGLNSGGGDANPLLGCVRTVSPGPTPFGALDLVEGGEGGVRVEGWALDPDVAAPVQVHVYVDGVPRLVTTAAALREDVGRVHPGWGPDHGFRVGVGGIAPGTHTVCVYAINEAGGTENPLLACRAAVVR